jgi:tetratricopeptide (TPR) repeat protein
LQGSVRRADSRIRVNVHLIDAISGGHLWADRFDRELTDIFATQDEIVGKIIGALTGKIGAKCESKRYKPTNMEAFDLCMKGRKECWVSMEAGTRARETFRQVIALDPHYAEAWRWLALGNAMSWLHFGGPMEPARSNSIVEAKKAVELDPHDPDAHWVLSMILLYERQWEAAAQESDLSIELNPNCADAWSFRSDLKVMDGKSEEALECAERAYLLDPFQPARNLWDLGQAQFAAGQYAAVVETLRKDTVYRTGARRILVAALAKLGRMEEAHEERRLYLADNPHFTIQFWVESQPFRDLAMRDRFVEAYRLAGLPEKAQVPTGTVDQ